MGRHRGPITVYRFKRVGTDDNENGLYQAQSRTSETSWEALPDVPPLTCEQAKKALVTYAGRKLEGNFVGDFESCSN